MSSSGRRDVEKEKAWREIVAKQEKSGLGIRAFCQSEQIKEPAFYAWRRELRIREGEKDSNSVKTKGSTEDSTPSFVPLQVIGNVHDDSLLEIQLASGHQLRVPGGFDYETLKNVIAVLEQAGC